MCFNWIKISHCLLNQYTHSSAHNTSIHLRMIQHLRKPRIWFIISNYFHLMSCIIHRDIFLFWKRKMWGKSRAEIMIYIHTPWFLLFLFFFVFFFNTLDVWWIPKIFDSVFMCFDSNNPVNWNSCVFLITILCVGTYLISSSKISSHFLILKRFFVFLKQVSNIWFCFCFVLFLVIWSLWDDVSLFCPWSSCPGLIFQASRERVFV